MERRSCDLPTKFVKKAVQVLVHVRSRLAAVHGARGHVVDEVVMLRIEPVLLTLAVQRDLGPIELAIGVAESTGAVLLSLRRLDALGVTDGARVLDLAADFLLVGVAQTAICLLDTVGKGVNVNTSVLADGLHNPLDAKYRSDALAVVGAQQHADAGCKFVGDWT